MDKIKELRMTAIIMLVSVFLLSGCLFPSKHEVTFKTNGGSEIKSASVKSGNKLEAPENPTKDGYVFEGWYLNGKEYNFEEEVEEDITLVAKWRKVDVDGEEENKDDENNENNDDVTTDATTKKTTTKKSTTEGIKTTTKTGTTSSKKVTTTTKSSTTTSTTTTTTSSTTTKKPTTTTTTTQKVEVEKPEEPIKPTEPVTPEEPTVPEEPTTPEEPTDPTIPDEPVINEKKELKMNITVTQEEIVESNIINISNMNNSILNKITIDNINNTNEEEIKKRYHLTLDLDSENVNVTSNLSDEDLQELLSSDTNAWQIMSNKGVSYEITWLDNKVSLISDDEINVITLVISEDKQYVIVYNEEDNIWTIDYPSVSLEMDDNKTYYASLEDALLVSIANSKITILKDLELTNMVIIDKALSIDGGNKLIKCSDEYLFNIKNIEEIGSNITISNMNVIVNNLIKIEDEEIKTIVIDNVKNGE